MTRLAALAAALALVGAASASAGTPVFTVVESSSTPSLPSAEVPNAPGSIALPLAFTAPPPVTRTMGFVELNALWHRAGAAYGIPWQVLAAINKIESNFGRNMGPSSAGAVGWMQFMPSTWLRWGTDADGDGLADPWAPEDAVYSAARYLAAAGAREDLERGIFAYNHADWYVRDVVELAATFGGGGTAVTFDLDRRDVHLEEASAEVARANQALLRVIRREQAARRVERRLARKAALAALLSDRLELERRAFAAGARAARAAEVVRSRRDALAAAKAEFDAARMGAAAVPTAGNLFGSAAFAAGYAFPVGGGPASVSVAHDHHDYPAADIAAPSGAPLYALTDGLVDAAWPLGSGACGIGFKMLAADGRSWTYCHLSFLEPSVTVGAALAAGTPVGLVGSTGNSTGPHLHLQTGPELTHPQEEPWFQAFSGTAFSWQDDGTHAHGSTEEFSPIPVFTPVEERVFEVVETEAASPDVVEFTLNT